MKGPELVKQAKSNMKKIDSLQKKRENNRKNHEEDVWKLKWNVYHARIRALEQERDQAVSKLEEKYGRADATKKQKIEALTEVISRAERIATFLKLDTSQDLKVGNDALKGSGKGMTAIIPFIEKRDLLIP